MRDFPHDCGTVDTYVTAISLLCAIKILIFCMCECMSFLQGSNTFVKSYPGRAYHGGIRYGALSSQRSHSNAYAVLSPLAATLLMAQTQSIIVTCTGFHAFGTRSRVWRRWTKFNTVTSHPLGWKSRDRWSTKWSMTASSNADRWSAK